MNPALSPAPRRTGWLTAIEARLDPGLCGFAALLLALGTLVMWVWSFTSGTGLLDGLARPVGTDFSSFWVAGHMALTADPQLVYQPKLHFAAQRALFGPGYHDYYGFFYPPTFLLLSWGLATLPYLKALLVWQVGGLLLYFAALRQLLPKSWAMAAAIFGFPAVFLALGHGQNSFLTTGLFTFGLIALPRRPVWAGVCFGLLAYKPQLALLVPVALVAAGQGRAFVAAGFTVIGFCAATALAFGPHIFVRYLDLGAVTQHLLLEQGGPGWHKMASLFAFLRSIGVGVPLAYAAQTLLSIGCAVLVWQVWRSAAPTRLKHGLLCVAVLLATPFVLDYDLLLLAPALACFAAHAMETGWQPGERLAVALVFTAPLYARTVAEASLVPLGWLATLMLLALLWRRTRAGESFSAATSRRPISPLPQ